MSAPDARFPSDPDDVTAPSGPGTVVSDRPPSGPPLAPHGWDLPLLGAAMLLAGFGVVAIVAASVHIGQHDYSRPLHFVTRQVAGLALGAAGAATVLTVPWRWVRRAAVPFWLVMTVAMFLVHTPLGHAAKGAPRWIDLGPFNLQPSELAKVALALVLADHLARNEGRLRDVWGTVIGPSVIFLGPLLLGAFLQSDLGTIALLLGIGGVAFFVAGLDLVWMGAAMAGTSALGLVLIAIEPYRASRVLNFMDPHADAQGDGYQIVQGWVAMAVGGLFGEGLGRGVAQQGFLPEAHTDMISAVITEELGVIGWTAIFVLHGILLWRGLGIALRARTLFDMVLASTISALLAAQVLVNTGVVAGLVPPKGLVLPFLSYGASAALAHTLAIGLLLRIGLESAEAVEVSNDTLGVSDPGTDPSAPRSGRRVPVPLGRPTAGR